MPEVDAQERDPRLAGQFGAPQDRTVAPEDAHEFAAVGRSLLVGDEQARGVELGVVGGVTDGYGGLDAGGAQHAGDDDGQILQVGPHRV